MFNPIISFSIAFTIGFSASDLFAQELVHDLTDPTRPATRISAPDSGHHKNNGVYKVSQIYISQKQQMAIVNGRKVKMGDSVDGAEVLAVKSGSVSLLVDGSITKFTIIPSIKQYKK